MSTQRSPYGPHSMVRRQWLLGSAAALLGAGAQSRAPEVLRVGVPHEVADDYARFLGQRDVAALAHFGGTHARRDVMELAYLLREVARHPLAPRVQLVRIDDYVRLLSELAAQRLDALGFCVWRSDLDTQGDAVRASAPVLARGQFVVGVYTGVENAAAQGVRTLQQLRTLRFVCNSAWMQDWRTLRKLGVDPAFDVGSWTQIVQLVALGRADAVLAPFPATPDLSLRAQDQTLVPISGLAVALDGTRHFACSRSKAAKWLEKEVFTVVARHARDGSLRRAYEECGFFPLATRGWKVLTP